MVASAFRRPGFAAVGALAVGIALFAPAALAQAPLRPAAAPASPRGPLVEMPSLAPIVKSVLPAVVNVSVVQRPGAAQTEEDNPDGGDLPGAEPDAPSSPLDELLRRFFEQQGRPSPNTRSVALGSGFIIDPAGYIVTDNHVVESADKVTVILQDNSRHPAKIVGRDPLTDLALLKIDAPKALPAVSWGDSDAAEVGDWVLAVGNPFSLGGTVSAGILSARGRDIHSGPYDDYLQIDASINRGNSGGPTFNLRGEVIGINTAIYSPNGGSVGIGFAIPSSQARPVIDQLRQHGKVERAWLGVQIQEVTPEIAKSMGLPKPGGVLIADVTPGGPAEKAGIKQGDVIVGFNGKDIVKLRDLQLMVAQSPIAQKAEVKLWRKSKEVTIQPVLAAMPDNIRTASAGTPRGRGDTERPPQGHQVTALGLKLGALTPELRQRLRLPKSLKGVAVLGVAPDSPLGDLGLEPGDVIEEIGQQPVASPEDAAARLKESAKNKSTLMLINRQGTHQYLALESDTGRR